MITETQRLLLQTLVIADAPFILELVNSRGWLKYIGDRNIRTLEDAQRYIEEGPFKSYEQNGFGLLKVVSKETKADLGLCGLLKRSHLPSPDIGFAFLPEYNGRGYATESAKAVLEMAKINHQLNEVCAITTHDNAASQAVLKKVGFTDSGVVIDPVTKQELRYWIKGIL